VAVSFTGRETNSPAQSHLQTLSHDHNSSLIARSLTNFITWPQLLSHCKRQKDPK